MRILRRQNSMRAVSTVQATRLHCAEPATDPPVRVCGDRLESATLPVRILRRQNSMKAVWGVQTTRLHCAEPATDPPVRVCGHRLECVAPPRSLCEFYAGRTQ